MEKYRINPENGLEFGLYSLGDHLTNPQTGKRISEQERVRQFVEMAKLADEAGLDVFGLGESHQEFFAGQAHTVILGAIAQATEKIKITSASTIISTSDPVRVYEDFSTIDLLSNGRAEIVAGRASRIGLFDLLGYDIRDYGELYEEKFALLNQLNEEKVVDWSGEYRAALHQAELFPKPKNGRIPIWRAVGGHAASAIKAGAAGVPMMLASLGGPVSSFKAVIEAYRRSLTENGYNPEEMPVATAGLFYTAEDSQQAVHEYYVHVNEGMKRTNGGGFPQQLFLQAPQRDQAMMVGSPQQIVEKILYQHEQYGHQRYLAQIDFGGVPFEKILQNIEVIGTKILPEVRKYTKPKKG